MCRVKFLMSSTAAAKAKKHCFLSVAPSSSSATGGNVKLQESSDFSDQLNSAESFKRKSRVAHLPKPGTAGSISLILLFYLHRHIFAFHISSRHLLTHITPAVNLKANY